VFYPTYPYHILCVLLCFELVYSLSLCFFFFFSSRRRHTRSYGDWSSDVCSSDLWRTPWNLRRYRIAQFQLGDVRRQMGLDDSAGATAIAFLGKMHDHIGSPERTHGFKRQEFRIAGTDADAD